MVLTLTKTKILGPYQVSITKAEAGKSTNGHDQVNLELLVVDAPNPAHVKQTIKFQRFMLNSPNLVNRFIAFVEAATGEEIPPDTEVSFDERELVSHRVCVNLAEREYTKGDGTPGKSLDIDDFAPAVEWPEFLRAHSGPF